MIQRDVLQNYLEEYLSCKSFDDYAPNGIQVEGKAEIRTIATAVTASLRVINQAIAIGADALLVHHGYFWRGDASIITGMQRQRISALIKHDLNLFAYHLPLDCHPKIGNNACLATLLPVHDLNMHTIKKTPNLLMTGTLNHPLRASELETILTNVLLRKPMHIVGTNQLLKRIAWCSGAADSLITEAHNLQVDAYISGEVSERTYYQAEELGIDYFACGHHATERYGIQALGAHLSSLFDLEYHFIDSDNPI